MIPFILANKEFNLPSRHGELTLRQFLELRETKEIDIITLLCILTRLDRADIMRISQLDFDTKIAKHLDFLNQPFDYIFPLPTYLEIGGNKHMIPDITRCTFGQKVTFDQVYNQAAKEGKSEFDIYSKALSIYLQPLIQQKEFHENYIEVEDSVLELPIEIALPVASFFLQSWKKYTVAKMKNSDAIIRPSKSKLVFTILKSSGCLPLYTALRNRLISLMNRCSRWIITLSLRHSTTRKNRLSISETLAKLTNDHS